jgi:wyosine [tRNA(Phe)-imidazoG37] synthetase (radical SAM superfamily)
MPLQHGIIYGPVQSRRLGASLGINLLPSEYKLCSFNCLYCQYGWTKRVTFAPGERLQDLPSVGAVAAALESELALLSSGRGTIDAITICGNGEPTLYPARAEVVTRVKRIRDRYEPKARVAILSNSSTVGNAAVRAALELVDVKIMKFDAGTEGMFRQLNHPAAPVYMGEIVAGLKQLKDPHLQSCFVQGRVTNADPDSVAIWIDKVREIHPVAVQLYTLDREPADKRIERVSHATLAWIAHALRWRGGLPAQIY